MLMNNGNILMTMTNGLEQARDDHKKFMYARAIHSNHMIQYHMQQILEQQKVVDESRSMMQDGMDLTPLQSNLYKSDLAVILHIIHMIEVDVNPNRDSPNGYPTVTPTELQPVTLAH